MEAFNGGFPIVWAASRRALLHGSAGRAVAKTWVDAGSPYIDQLPLNRYFAGRRKFVSPRYGYLPGLAGAVRAREGLDDGRPKVLHSGLRIEPWMTDAMLRRSQGIPHATRDPNPSSGSGTLPIRAASREAASATRGGAARGRNRRADDGRGSSALSAGRPVRLANPWRGPYTRRARNGAGARIR